MGAIESGKISVEGAERQMTSLARDLKYETVGEAQRRASAARIRENLAKWAAVIKVAGLPPR